MRKGRTLARIFLPHSRSILWGKFVLLLLNAAQVRADNGWEGQLLSFTWDNDATYGTDRHYTQGAQLSYYSRDDALPGWMRKIADFLPAVGFEVQARKWGLNAGQQIFTPDDLKAREIIEDDRPYAAWLYAGIKLQRRGLASFGWPVMETIGLEAGTIGPEALGREAQGILHLVEPKGWRNQLKSEAGGMVEYERRYLYRHPHEGRSWDIDLLPHFALTAGNIMTYAGAGSTLRFGWNVPNEFEAAPEPTPLKFGGYMFLGLEGRAVLQNIFLDGNTFRDSHHVSKKVMVGDFRAGLVLVLKKVEITLSQTFRSREFAHQKHNDSYGTLTLLLKF